MRSRGGAVLVAALTVDSIGNGLFAPLSWVYFNTVYAMTSFMLALALPTVVLAGAGPA